MSEKQSCAADIVYKQIDGGWHQYTVSLRPGQNYSWKDILADADSIAAADLSPIVNVQLMTAAGKASPPIMPPKGLLLPDLCPSKNAPVS